MQGHRQSRSRSSSGLFVFPLQTSYYPQSPCPSVSFEKGSGVSLCLGLSWICLVVKSCRAAVKRKLWPDALSCCPSEQDVCIWANSLLIWDTSVHKRVHLGACDHVDVLALSISYIWCICLPWPPSLWRAQSVYPCCVGHLCVPAVMQAALDRMRSSDKGQVSSPSLIICLLSMRVTDDRGRDVSVCKRMPLRWKDALCACGEMELSLRLIVRILWWCLPHKRRLHCFPHELVHTLCKCAQLFISFVALLWAFVLLEEWKL